jgi:hypothetical protein
MPSDCARSNRRNAFSTQYIAAGNATMAPTCGKYSRSALCPANVKIVAPTSAAAWRTPISRRKSHVKMPSANSFIAADRSSAALNPST